MSRLYDSVEWQALVPLPGPFAGYRDGALYAWSEMAWSQLGARTPIEITVNADWRFNTFDSENGDAPTDEVASALATRLDQRLWSWAYTNGSNLPALTTSMRSKSLSWADASLWPQPGVYLWAASPGIPQGRTPPWSPVAPVAVQDTWGATYNSSTLFVDIDYHPPPPPPPPLEEYPVPVAQIEAYNQLHTFTVDAKSELVHRFYSDDGKGWAREVRASGCAYPQTPSVSLGFNGQLHVFADANNGEQVHCFYSQPAGWAFEALT